MTIDEDTLLRVRALRRRGLSRMLAVQLWSAGDESLLSDLERATDDQLRELNRLESGRRRGSEIRFTAGADIRAGETVTVDPSTGMLVPVPYDGRREPARDQTVIELLCQTLERTGFRTMNGETFEEWARARVAAGDYPEKPEREGQRTSLAYVDESQRWTPEQMSQISAFGLCWCGAPRKAESFEMTHGRHTRLVCSANPEHVQS